MKSKKNMNAQDLSLIEQCRHEPSIGDHAPKPMFFDERYVLPIHGENLLLQISLYFRFFHSFAWVSIKRTAAKSWNFIFRKPISKTSNRCD